MNLSFDIIKSVLDYIRANPQNAKTDIVEHLQQIGFDPERAQYWINSFQETINLYRGVPNTIKNAKNWVLEQNVDTNKLTDMLIGMLSALWSDNEDVTITKGGQVYKTVNSGAKRLKQLQARKQKLEDRLRRLTPPTDDELLEWAQKNHPYSIESLSIRSEIGLIDDEIRRLMES